MRLLRGVRSMWAHVRELYLWLRWFHLEAPTWAKHVAILGSAVNVLMMVVNTMEGDWGWVVLFAVLLVIASWTWVWVPLRTYLRYRGEPAYVELAHKRDQDIAIHDITRWVS